MRFAFYGLSIFYHMVLCASAGPAGNLCVRLAVDGRVCSDEHGRNCEGAVCVSEMPEVSVGEQPDTGRIGKITKEESSRYDTGVIPLFCIKRLILSGQLQFSYPCEKFCFIHGRFQHLPLHQLRTGTACLQFFWYLPHPASTGGKQISSVIGGRYLFHK